MCEGKFLSLKQAARALGVRRLWRLVHQGRVPAVKIGNCWRIPASALEQLEQEAFKNVGYKPEAAKQTEEVTNA